MRTEIDCSEFEPGCCSLGDFLSEYDVDMGATVNQYDIECNAKYEADCAAGMEATHDFTAENINEVIREFKYILVNLPE